MDSILLSQTPDHYQQRRRVTRRDLTPVPHRYFKVLALHLAGQSCKQICEETGYKSPTVYRILQDERVLALRQQLLAQTQQEFEALFPTVVQGLRDNLTSANADVKQHAIDSWVRAYEKLMPNQGEAKAVTAEDVVFHILNQGDGNVQVNVNVGRTDAAE